MKFFFKNIKKYNLTYAIGLILWYILDDMKNIKVGKFQDKLEQMLNQHDKHLDQLYEDYKEHVGEIEERIPTPCGCLIFNDCKECSSSHVCSSYEDLI